VPSGDVWVRGDAVYGPCSLNWWPTGVIKVRDGSVVTVQYWPEGFIDIVVHKYIPFYYPRTADPEDPSDENPEKGWPLNPFVVPKPSPPARTR
jgi:hypothetical protein